MNQFDVIVVGAGHAGIEAALASSRIGAKTLVLTIHLDNIALMPCNPSIGGSAKGHLVREIDALGGEMGVCIDETLLQIRTLNKKKGPAIQALRAQADKILYQIRMKKTLEKQENLTLRQAIVKELIVENEKIKGIKTIQGQSYFSKCVIITTGTFLNGKCHIGRNIIPAGRIGEPPALFLSENIESFGIKKGRLKTGTPPRILSSSICYDGLEIETGEDPAPVFSFLNDPKKGLCQLPCHIVYTTEKTRKIILDNIHLSPLFSGQIEGIGPRYCPSIEDKFHKFPDKLSHLLYLEPESRFNHEIYLQGFSSSLPHSVQIEMVHSLPGLENAHILRPGYAVEYDFFDPIQLYPSLQSKIIEGLYFAGQINGTSGYEEAAAQGIVAGINAARHIMNKPPIEITRENSYAGVLIYDLVTKGVTEPYRMFSSLVEHRTWIRHDNADERLTKIGYDAGLASKTRMKKFEEKQQKIAQTLTYLSEIKLNYEDLSNLQTSPFQGLKTASELLKRPEINLASMAESIKSIDTLYKSEKQEIIKETEICIKYEGYINKQKDILKKREKFLDVKIPCDIDYQKIKALSKEGRQKLDRVKPQNLAQATMISGLRESDLALLASWLKKELKNFVIILVFLLSIPEIFGSSLLTNPLDLFGNQEKLQENSPDYLGDLARKYSDSSPLKAAHIYAALIKRHQIDMHREFAKSLNKANQKFLSCLFVKMNALNPDLCLYQKSEFEPVLDALNAKNLLHQFSDAKTAPWMFDSDIKISPSPSDQNLIKNLEKTGFLEYLRFKKLILSPEPDKKEIIKYPSNKIDPFFRCPIQNIQKIYSEKNNLDTCYPFNEFEWIENVAKEENGFPINSLKKHFPKTFFLSSFLFNPKKEADWNLLAKASLISGSKDFFLPWQEKIKDHSKRFYFKTMIETEKETDLPVPIEKSGYFHPGVQEDFNKIRTLFPEIPVLHSKGLSPVHITAPASELAGLTSGGSRLQGTDSGLQGTEKPLEKWYISSHLKKATQNSFSFYFFKSEIPFSFHPFLNEVWISKKVATLPPDLRKNIFTLIFLIAKEKNLHPSWPQWILYSLALKNMKVDTKLIHSLKSKEEYSAFYPLSLNSVASFPLNQNQEDDWWAWLRQLYEIGTSVNLITLIFEPENLIKELRNKKLIPDF